MIHYTKYGNIFNLEGVSSYAHGCNCAGAMGKGIALQFKEKFPSMYLIYKELCTEKKFSPGDVFAFDYGGGTIFNLGTQLTWKSKASVVAIEESTSKMLKLAREKNITKIALPKIGAGLGGLDWEDVKTVLQKISRLHPTIDLFVVENYEPTSQP